jgi:hypothetical protein
MHSRARLNPPVVFGLKGVAGKVRPARPSESGTRHFTPRRHTYTVRLRDKRYIRLIELIDANRKKTVTGKGGLGASPQNINGETHHYTFIAAVCMLMPDSVPIIPTTFDTVVVLVQVAIATISATQSKLWWLGRRGLLARAGTPTPCSCASAQRRWAGRDVR